VLSGILESQANAVAAAYAQWFNMKLWARECDWVVLVGARSAE
jgi:ribosomal protein L11 methylase PrmA